MKTRFKESFLLLKLLTQVIFELIISICELSITMIRSFPHYIIIGVGMTTLACNNNLYAKEKQPFGINAKSNNIAEIIQLLEDYKRKILSSPGMTPKEYGIRFGNGKSRKHKTNKKHRSHLHRISNQA